LAPLSEKIVRDCIASLVIGRQRETPGPTMTILLVPLTS